MQQKQYTRRCPPSATPRRVQKTTSGFTAQPCLSAQDPSRGTQTVRVCYANANNDSCPNGYGNSTGRDLGYNWGRACDEWELTCYKSGYLMDDATVKGCCNGRIPQNQCDPSLCPGSAECRRRMIGYCDSDNYLSSDCQTWMNQLGNEDVRGNIMSKRCTSYDMYGDGAPCRTFCMKNPGACDEQMASYCSSKACSDKAKQVFNYCGIGVGPKPDWISSIAQCDKLLQDYSADWQGCNRQNYGVADPACACFNSALNKVDQTVAPVACFDDKCKSGYWTANMNTIAKNCPTYVDCRAAIASIDNATISGSTILQNCSAQVSKQNADDQKAMLDAEIARMKQEQVAAAARQASSDTPPPNEPEVSPPKEPGAMGERVADTVPPSIAPIFGDLTTGAILMLFFILLVLLSVLYIQWKRQSAAKLQTLAGGLQEASRLISQKRQSETLRNTTAAMAMEKERQKKALDLLELQRGVAELPPVGGK